MMFLRSHFPRLLLILALVALGAGLCALLIPAESRAVQQQLMGFPDSDVQAQQARPWIIAALSFLPALASLCYAMGGTLARYITRQFLGIFSICLAGLILIWLLIDISDNISEFRNSPELLRTIGTYYATSLPAIVLQLLPYSLLLALLQALGKLSTNREIIAMIQSGRGVLRITLPLIIAGILCSLLCLGLNYHWAPVAEGNKNDVIAQTSGKATTEATQVLYHNPENHRLWMIGSFPSDYQNNKALRNIEVTTTDDHNRLQSRLTASQALWDRTQREWTFQNPVIARYTPGRPPEFERLADSLIITSWAETPWQLIKPGLSAAHLGIPDLNAWLQANSRHQPFADASPYLTQWHYRWALPLTCLVTVLLATPLAIHFTRRGSGGNLFLAVVLSALMLLVSSIVLALGEAGNLRPAYAAWLPNLAFTLLAILLFHRRITGRPIYHALRKLLPGAP